MDEWAKIPTETLQNLVESLLRRVKAVTAATRTVSLYLYNPLVMVAVEEKSNTVIHHADITIDWCCTDFVLGACSLRLAEREKAPHCCGHRP